MTQRRDFRIHSVFFTLIMVFTLIVTIRVSAQNEIEREQSSLRGISEMGFTVNLEYNVTLTEEGALEITSIKDAAIERLKKSGLTILSDRDVRSSDEVPFLYMHINTMDAGRGLVPYSVSLRFYQPVKLSLNRDLQTSASTWETGLVGIVSYDRLNVIKESAVNLLFDFIDDYNKINDFQ